MRTITMTLLAGLLLAASLSIMGCEKKTGANPADVCKKLEQLATKEGGEALAMWNKEMKGDCEKQVQKDKERLGDAKFGELIACLDGKDSFTAALNCAQ